jgi:dolichol-phosphate mannosyltransferase
LDSTPPDPGRESRPGACPPSVSVVVPTLREAENLPLLIPRISEALRGQEHEILVVDDDSRDGTVEVCRALSDRYPVRLLVRDQPRNGLGGAVVEGMRFARGDVLVVLDADLQHPPEMIPELVACLANEGTDFVVGSRNVPGGSTADRWTVVRKLNSWVATELARPFAHGVRDPMSGFFALRRKTFENADRLSPLGYKIGLELMCKCRVGRVEEVPIHFSLRQKGASKLSLKEQFHYLEHLSRLYDFRLPRASPYFKFLVATGLGWLAAWVVLFGILEGRALLPFACTASYVAAVLVTALFHARYIRTQREFLVTAHPWRDFWLIVTAELVACAAVASWLANSLRSPTTATVSLLSFGSASVVRYVLRKELLQDVRGLRQERRV